eukprot:7337602-Pyramimonas_sp.AAC.1
MPAAPWRGAAVVADADEEAADAPLAEAVPRILVKLCASSFKAVGERRGSIGAEAPSSTQASSAQKAFGRLIFLSALCLALNSRAAFDDAGPCDWNLNKFTPWMRTEAS